MTAQSPPAPPLTAEAYRHCFLTFRDYSTEWQGMLDWCRREIPGLLPAKAHLSALSVGAGNGDFDWRLLPMLKSRASSLEYVIVEPSRAMCNRLRDRMIREPLDGVAFDLEAVRFEDCGLGRTFDLVLLTQCLYYIPDRESALRHAAGLAGETGRVLVFHQTPLGIDQIQRRYIKRLKGSDGEMITSREIQDILDGAEIPYRLERIDSHIDVSECFRPGSEAGESLLSFFLECDVRRVDAGLKRELLDHVHDLSFGEGGKRLLRHPVAVFLLSGGSK